MPSAAYLLALRAAAEKTLVGLAVPPVNEELMISWSEADARRYFEQSIELHGNHPKTYLAWARMEHRLGQLSRARELLEQGLGKDPTNPFLMQALGILEQDVGDMDAARTTRRRSAQSS